ncbi:helix-turn-helix transcriptional regulator [Gorillibacterium sp. sgz5001074]|uniref:helix-turn-helix transcriptional regulator n=1 Tax=Gorillibacterium sp. sgz5001074 TaxID=3446695 RepID=UPI003F681F34
MSAYFDRLNEAIPVFRRISVHSGTHVEECCPGTYALVVVRKGHIGISFGGGPPKVCVQAYACHPAQGPFRIQVPATRDAEYVIIRYGMLPDTMEWSLEGPLQSTSEIKIFYMLEEMERTQQELPAPVESGEEAARRFRLRLMLERILFIYLYETVRSPADSSPGHTVEESLSYIHEHYMMKLTVPMLARRAGISEGHYSVLFKKLTGTSLVPYLNRLRIAKAKQLLEQTDWSAKEVAQRTGFNDYFHFSRTFKKIAGTAPHRFREMVQILE